MIRGVLLGLLMLSACGRVGFTPVGLDSRPDGTGGIDGDVPPRVLDGGGGSTGDADTSDVGPDGSMDAATDGGAADTGADTGPLVCVDPICDLWPQCGCPTLEKCEADLSGARTCNPAGSATHGVACTRAGDPACEIGTTCVAYGSTPALCRQFCRSHGDCAGNGPASLCMVSTGFAIMCTVPCDLVAQTGCPAGAQCTLFNSSVQAGTECTDIGASAVGAGCASNLDCAPGACVGGICREYCEFGGTDTCRGATTCASTGLTIGAFQVGYCR